MGRESPATCTDSLAAAGGPAHTPPSVVSPARASRLPNWPVTLGERRRWKSIMNRKNDARPLSYAQSRRRRGRGLCALQFASPKPHGSLLPSSCQRRPFLPAMTLPRPLARSPEPGRRTGDGNDVRWWDEAKLPTRIPTSERESLTTRHRTSTRSAPEGHLNRIQVPAPCQRSACPGSNVVSARLVK
jgi:hypothetical protein